MISVSPASANVYHDSSLQLDTAGAAFNKNRSAAGYDSASGTIALNANALDLSRTDNRLYAIGHEGYHALADQAGYGFGSETEELLAESFGASARDVWRAYSYLGGYETDVGGADFNQAAWLNANADSRALRRGNAWMRQADSTAMKPYCGIDANCYGGDFAERFRSARKVVSIGESGPYRMMAKLDPETDEVVGYLAYNPKSRETITMKPQEVADFYPLAESGLAELALEGQPNYAHIPANYANGLYEGSLLEMYRDDWAQALDDPGFREVVALGLVGAGVGRLMTYGGRITEIGVGGSNAAAAQLAKNKAVGDAFEDVIDKELRESHEIVAPQITIKTTSGTRTRIDYVTRDGKRIGCVECKSSGTAPLAPNQKIAFPEIEQSGGVVVGKGKAGITGGTVIPPGTKVKVRRP